MKISKAVLEVSELKAHLADESNSYLYKKEDDDSITCYMCCDFDVIDCSEIVFSGSCGNGINYNKNRDELRRVD